jgi:hypothetical protein
MQRAGLAVRHGLAYVYIKYKRTRRRFHLSGTAVYRTRNEKIIHKIKKETNMRKTGHPPKQMRCGCSVRRMLMALILFSVGSVATAQTMVSSLSELKTYLDKDKVNIKMKPGTYVFNTDNCGEGKLFPDPTLILITGEKSVYDFTDVKFEFDTHIFTAYGRVEVIEFQLVGRDNVVKNLTMEDIGNTTPTRTALCMSLDGKDNRIEGFTATTRGSAPYGYGDIFGKGHGSSISLHKHGGCQFRGINNHLKNCRFYLHTYGHGIFIQGAKDALVEGCWVEGELRTTDEVLAEKGTGSPADELDFMTTWGFTLQPGNTFSLQEDGIRCYKTGIVYGSGGESTDTVGVKVIDCTVKFMRTGVTIGWNLGEKYVENCTALGTESGFWVGSEGSVVNCRGDASVGPLYSEDVRRNGSTIELTLLDNVIPRHSTTPTLYLAGDDHEITIKDGTTTFHPEMKILVGGSRLGHRFGPKPPFFEASDLTINNLTKYPLILGENSSGNKVKSRGKVTDNGSRNKVRKM